MGVHGVGVHSHSPWGGMSCVGMRVAALCRCPGTHCGAASPTKPHPHPVYPQPPHPMPPPTMSPPYRDGFAFALQEGPGGGPDGAPLYLPFLEVLAEFSPRLLQSDRALM